MSDLPPVRRALLAQLTHREGGEAVVQVKPAAAAAATTPQALDLWGGGDRGDSGQRNERERHPCSQPGAGERLAA